MAPAAVVNGSPPAVRIEGLEKRYRRRTAVAGVSLEVRPGQVYGLIGPDGAGKSSILKAVAGVLSFEGGRVEVLGTAVDSEAAAERVKGQLGFMPQGLGLNLYPDLSVEENVDFFARLRAVAPGRLAELKGALLAATRLAPFRDRVVKQLSGGMKQKLGLVCTLVHDPALLVLDEPTTGVDPVSRRDFWAILSDLVRTRAITALVSTAYMDEARRFDRLAFVHEGRILAEGEPDDIRARAGGRVVTVGAAPQLEALGRLRAAFPLVEAEGPALRVLVDEADGAAAAARVRSALRGLAVASVETGELELEDAFVMRLRTGTPAAEALPPGTVGGAAPKRPTTTDLVIEAAGLTRDFGAFRAVDGVSFGIRPGEIFGLLGANGAGKTTVIKMLTGILRPTAGVGQVAGVDMRRPGLAIKRRIGYVSQAFSLYQDLTVAENIRLYGGIYGLERAEARERGQWALALGTLGGHEETVTADLPMGLRQRLALACALLHRPQALFLDEPTSGVDPVGRRRFWDILFALARQEGVAILITTHYMSEAEHCDRLGLMFAGRLVADAPPAEMKARVEAEAGRLAEVVTDEPERARDLLAQAGVADVAVFGRRLRLLTADLPGTVARVRRILAAQNIVVRAVEARPLTMEDVFVYRVRALERAAEARPA